MGKSHEGIQNGNLWNPNVNPIRHISKLIQRLEPEDMQSTTSVVKRDHKRKKRNQINLVSMSETQIRVGRLGLLMIENWRGKMRTSKAHEAHVL